MKSTWKCLFSVVVASLLAVTPCHADSLGIANSPNATPLPTLNHGCYIDIGSLSYQGFMLWYPEEKLDTLKFDQYLGSLFTQLKYSGITKIYLSFAQLASIDILLNDGAGAPIGDVVARMMIELPGGLKELIRIAHLNGMRVDLSFGGEAANAMKICGPGETPQGQAEKLVLFMQNYNIDGLDFDLENTLFTNANPKSISVPFFKTLFNLLSSQGKTSTLTIMGSIADWPKNYLKPLFYDASNRLIVDQLFHRINLMLYSATQYYLDADDPTWGIQQWLDLVGHDKASLLSIGFEDNINYCRPQASAGGAYVVDPNDPGIAAAQIYSQILATLQARGYPTNFSPPFFWPDNNRHDPGTWSRYQAITQNGRTSVKFSPQMMKSFYLKMLSSP